MTAVIACWGSRLLAVTPPGRVHERHVRRHLGMPARHPERVTRPPRLRHQRHLEALQGELWPENEWADLISAYWRQP